MWFERKGAFEKTENLRYFLRFAEKMVRAFGERVCEYITLNEPNVYAMLGYFTGEWPPGGRNFFRMNKVVSVMATGHIRTYEMIHRVRLEMGLRDTKVGFAHHMRAFAPASSDRWLDRRLARLAETIFQDSLSFAALRGEFKWPLRNLGRIAPGIYADFHGLNYYTRSTICAFKDQVKKDAPVNDLGWEIYPDGLIETASRLHDILSADIYVTENGTCDNEDRFRCRYLYEHLKAISESTLPFRRYYHWCFCDNFEWVEGVSARFGIVHVDYDTQRRSIKRSGRFFSGIIERQGVDGQLYEMFVAPEAYGRLV
jgi:beta-glucosidase